MDKFPTDIDSVTAMWVTNTLADIAELDQPDYKQEYNKFVMELYGTSKAMMPSQLTRNRIASIMAEHYFQIMGGYPPSNILDKLADYCLLEDIKSVNKKKSDENRFLSEKQQNRRASREYCVSTNNTLFDFLYSKYTLQLDSLSKVSTMEVEQ